jgi:peptidoglycan pentaglycine glycine transferase (the first glycine)
MTNLSASEWESFLSQKANSHLLQTRAWGDFKAKFGWTPQRVVSGEAGAQVLFRKLPLGLVMAYIPHGPVGCDWAKLWPEVDVLCKKQKAFFLRVEPDLWQPVQPGTLDRLLPGFIPGLQTIQPPRTILIDLAGEESQILGRMKQKTRYNIHLAEKKEIVVRASNDLATFHRLMLETSQRDSFSVHSLDYYQQVFDHFYPLGACELLQAEYAGQALAALLVFKWGRRAWYLHGASSEAERSRMPAYLLQWETMRWARLKGCTEYDLWGVPDEDEETLEAEFSNRTEGLWGVYRFKRGFGGQLKRTVGVWDRVYDPALYFIYQKWINFRKSRED